MHLTQIDILKYKSIKNPVSVYFNEGKVVTLIGKNGSGKTNVLEALNYVFEANAKLNFYTRHSIELKYRAYIKLEKEDIETILPEVKYNADNNELIAYNYGEGLKIDTIESESLIPLLKQEILDIRVLAQRLKNSLEEYVKVVEAVCIEDRGNTSLVGFTLRDGKDHTTNFYSLKHYIDFNIKQALDLTDGLLKCFDDKENIFHYIANNYIRFYGLNDLEFKLEYDEPELSLFEQRYINIDKQGLKKAINRINKKTKDTCDQITELSTQLTRRANSISEALESDEIRLRTQEEKYFYFLKEVQNCIGRRSLFLRNNNSELLFGNQDRELQYRRTNTNYIVEAYLRQVYSGDNKDELLKAISENKQIELTQSAIKEFERYLNNSIPKFDRDMFTAVKVEYGKEKIISIKLQEKDELIDLNLTSAGRRWYFTYYFMKNTLQPGDIFIIDEPAGMLHPAAQKEVLAELQTLASKGLRVIYSTHSTYLIPDNFNIVHNVEMNSQEGTKVNSYGCNDDLLKSICDELGVQRTSEILFGLAKTTLIVEGEADKACLLKFFDVLKCDNSAYCIFECRGQPILDVAHLCITWDIKFKALFDRDTIEKSREGYLTDHGYKTYLEEIQRNPNCVFTPANGCRKSLEDCFAQIDQKRYFSEIKGVMKIDKEKIKIASEFEEETIKNFEQLFSQLGIPKLDDAKA